MGKTYIYILIKSKPSINNIIIVYKNRIYYTMIWRKEE